MTHLEKLEQEYTKETGKTPFYDYKELVEFVSWLSARDEAREKTVKVMRDHIAELEKD